MKKNKVYAIWGPMCYEADELLGICDSLTLAKSFCNEKNEGFSYDLHYHYQAIILNELPQC